MQLNSEQLREMGERTVSDADAIKRGAEYTQDEKGNIKLLFDPVQIMRLRTEKEGKEVNVENEKVLLGGSGKLFRKYEHLPTRPQDYETKGATLLLDEEELSRFMIFSIVRERLAIKGPEDSKHYLDPMPRNSSSIDGHTIENTQGFTPSLFNKKVNIIFLNEPFRDRYIETHDDILVPFDTQKLSLLAEDVYGSDVIKKFVEKVDKAIETVTNMQHPQPGNSYLIEDIVPNKSWDSINVRYRDKNSKNLTSNVITIE